MQSPPDKRRASERFLWSINAEEPPQVPPGQRQFGAETSLQGVLRDLAETRTQTCLEASGDLEMPLWQELGSKGQRKDFTYFPPKPAAKRLPAGDSRETVWHRKLEIIKKTGKREGT